MSPKLLEMLLSMVPKLSRVVVLVNPENSSHTIALRNVQAAARRTGVTILSFEAQTPQEIENAFSQMPGQKAGALIVARDAFFSQQVRQIAELAAKNRLPAVECGPDVPCGSFLATSASLDGRSANVRRFAQSGRLHPIRAVISVSPLCLRSCRRPPNSSRCQQYRRLQIRQGLCRHPCR
jgi:DNA-binding LacI/PurR family transcriptional regulator